MAEPIPTGSPFEFQQPDDQVEGEDFVTDHHTKRSLWSRNGPFLDFDAVQEAFNNLLRCHNFFPCLHAGKLGGKTRVDLQLLVGNDTDPVDAPVLKAGTGITITRDESNLTFAAINNGDVTGPGSATGDNLTAFDGTTGKIIKDSGIAMADVAAVVDATATKALNSANVAALTAFPVWHKVTHTFEDFIDGSGNVSLEALPAGTVWHMALAVTTEAFAAEGDPDITMEVSSALPISFIRSMNVKILNQQPEVPNEGDSRMWPPMDLGNSHTPTASLAFVDTGGGGGASDLTAGSVDIYLLLSKMA